MAPVSLGFRSSPNLHDLLFVIDVKLTECAACTILNTDACDETPPELEVNAVASSKRSSLSFSNFGFFKNETVAF
jgi:hypothetical protein